MTTNGTALRTVTSTAELEADGTAGYIKAIWAGASAGLAALGTALADGQITGLEWVGIAAAIVLAAGGTYGFANKFKPLTVIPAGHVMLTNPPPIPEPPLEPLLGVVDPPGRHEETPE